MKHCKNILHNAYYTIQNIEYNVIAYWSIDELISGPYRLDEMRPDLCKFLVRSDYFRHHGVTCDFIPIGVCTRESVFPVSDVVLLAIIHRPGARF